MPIQGLTIVNRRLQRYANQHAEEVTFLDCGAIFFDRPDRLSAKWLPDALHPSAAGDDGIWICRDDTIEDYSYTPWRTSIWYANAMDCC